MVNGTAHFHAAFDRFSGTERRGSMRISSGSWNT
jgi:hypothetical protein